MQLNFKNATIESVSTRSDKSLKIVLATRELPPEELAGMFLMLHQETEVVADIIDKEEKSPSKRLKDRLYVYFKEKHATDKGFQSWYEGVLDDVGRKYLDLLAPKN